MAMEVKRQLRKLSNKQIAEDIKKYIKSNYDFYGNQVPEFKVLAKKFHEEYSLRDFYKIFNRLWKSGHDKNSYLAVYTLQMYNEDFDLETWRFLKGKLKQIKSWDLIDSIGSNIIGNILLKYPELESEIMKMTKSRNRWLRRMALMSAIPFIRNNNINLAMKLITMNIHEKDESIQKAVGIIINEIGKVRQEFAKKFILKNIQMPIVMFNAATQDMKELRTLRQIKKLNPNGLGRIFFWRDV